MTMLLHAIRKDLSRWRQDTTAILIWLAIPFLVGGLMTLLMSDDGVKPRGVLLLADQDDTFLSGFVAGAYTQGELGELLSVEKVSLDDGLRKIDDGDASALLVIPKGFEDAILDSQAVTLRLRTNPSQIILPGIIRDVTEILLDAGFYAQKLFGDEIRRIRDFDEDSRPDSATVAAIAVVIQEKIDDVVRYLDPAALVVEIVDPPAEEPGAPIGLLVLPGIVLMAMMFSASGLAADYWVEREQGTLRRIVCAPGQLAVFVTGKAVAAAVVITVIGGLTLLAGFLYHGIPNSRFAPSLLWIAVSSLALFAWFSVLQMLGSSKRAADLISSFLLFPLLMAGGSFFPFEALPDWIAAIGRATPNGFVTDRLSTELTALAPWSIDIQSWLIVLAMAASGLALCGWRLQTGFARA